MKKTFLFFLCAVLIAGTSFAQSPKFGHIDSRMLLESMPEYKKADVDVQTYVKSFQDQIEAMSKEYAKKVQEFQAGEKTMTDAVKEVKVKEIQDLQARAESTQQSAQEKVAKKREELLSPILDKAQKAIEDVSKEKGYTYVFDKSAGSLLYAAPTDDMMPLVKTKLGIK
jgi:outer membrane protein